MKHSPKENPIPIPAIKSKSKIKPLKDKIALLEEEKATLLKELYSSGVRKRPTIISKIEEIEEKALHTVKEIIYECEQETGRDFPYHEL